MHTLAAAGSCVKRMYASTLGSARSPAHAFRPGAARWTRAPGRNESFGAFDQLQRPREPSAQTFSPSVQTALSKIAAVALKLAPGILAFVKIAFAKLP